MRIENFTCYRHVIGKRTAQAALKIACDLVDEGMRTEKEAVAMIEPRNLDALLHPTFDTAALKLLHRLQKLLVLLRVLLAVKSYSQLTMLLNGLQEERKLFWFVLKPHRKISQV